MEGQKIKVLALLPMELPKEIELDNTLEAMQNFVGGTFYMDEYALIFLFSRCIRCAQKRDCWEAKQLALIIADQCDL